MKSWILLKPNVLLFDCILTFNFFLDVLEELLQDSVHDELDVKDRDRAAHTLTRWAASSSVRKFRRNKDEQGNIAQGSIKQTQIIRVDIEQGFSSERAPLLNNHKR